MHSATATAVAPVGKSDPIVFDVGSLGERLRALPDPRHRRGVRYPLEILLVLIVLAKLSGANHPSAIAGWLRARTEAVRAAFHLPRPRLPHANTYRRIVEQVVPPTDLEAAVQAFFRAQPGVGRSVLIAIDGKTVRGTIGTDHPRGEHLLCAYLPEEGIVLFQVAVGLKENEITAAPTLLRTLDLRGKIVMGDALHTQRALSVQIREAGGDYLWFAKDNQPTLHADIATLFAPAEPTVLGGQVPTDFQTARTVDKGHGRRETRQITVSTELNAYLDWPDVAQVFRLDRDRVETKTGKTTHEVVYGLTSLTRDKASAPSLLGQIRSYWGIENGLHHRRDATFHEDRTRLTRGNAGHVMAILNNLVIGLLRRRGATNLAQARLDYGADLPSALHLLVTPARRL